MADQPEWTVHAMPLDALRTQAREAHRLIEQARGIVRASFERVATPDSGREKQVGAILDAIERLLPGLGLLAVQRTGPGDAEPRASGLVVATPTPRGRTREQIERGEVVSLLTDALASLLVEVERGRTSTVMRAFDVPASSSDVTMPAPRRS